MASTFALGEEPTASLSRYNRGCRHLFEVYAHDRRQPYLVRHRQGQIRANPCHGHPADAGGDMPGRGGGLRMKKRSPHFDILERTADGRRGSLPGTLWAKDVLVRGEDKGGRGSPGVRHPTLADMISMRSLSPDLKTLAPTICRRSLGNISSFFWISFSMLLRTPASSSSSALLLNRRSSRM